MLGIGVFLCEKSSNMEYNEFPEGYALARGKLIISNLIAHRGWKSDRLFGRKVLEVILWGANRTMTLSMKG